MLNSQFQLEEKVGHYNNFFCTPGAVKRCYKCRSRGDLGDCRNPFYADIEARQRASGARNPFLPNNQDPWGRQIDPYNRPDPFDAFQSGSLSSGVEAIPCSSGWCAKVIEGRGTFKADGKTLFRFDFIYTNSISLYNLLGSLRNSYFIVIYS